MSTATAEFFRELGQREHVPLLEKVKGTVRFELENGKRTDRWSVAIDDGKASVRHVGGKADCAIRMKESLFEGMISGEVNAMAAALRGEIAAQGDFELMFGFVRLFPGPPTSRSGGSR